MGELSHTDIEELLGAYALDAVEADEVDEIEEHLLTCPRCRAELTAHREVAGLFAYAGQSAPPGLWDRITAGMQEAPPELRLDRMRASMVTPESLVDGPPAPILSLERRRERRRRSVGMRVFSATVAAAAAIVAVLAIGLVHTHQQHPGTAGQQATMADVTRALDEKGSRKVDLISPSGHGASLDAVVTPSGMSYLYDGNLARLPDGRTYQVWGVVGSQEISYGLVGANPGAVVRFNAGTGVRALALTDEVASGVSVTHNPFVVEGTVTPTL